MTEVRLLGPLEVLAEGVPLSLGTPKQRLVLGMLALSPGRLVTLDALVDELWPATPPRSAVANVRTYAANLRRTLVAATADGQVLIREGSGYRLNLPPDSVDLNRFSADRRGAGELAELGELEAAAKLLTSALAWSRGPLLAGLPVGPATAGRRVAVEDELLGAVELLADVRIRQGRPDEAVRLIRQQYRLSLLRESAQLLLIRALYRQGDVAGALAAYRSARASLREHLGIEPGRELQRLHRSILNRDSAGDVPPRSTRERAPSHPVPVDWLPRAVSDFVGRADAVAQLLAVTDHDEGRPVVHLIDGMAGSGKTALAVHVARRLAGTHPDAQLFIDLSGHGEEAPVAPAAALVTLLRQLGVPAGLIPVELDLRIAHWRRELADRRVVLVLDNAASSEQIRPLLPSGPGTVVLVTSRRRLVLPDTELPLSLSVMTSDEALRLLAATVGADRIDAEPEAAAEVVRRCGHLPLAIRLAGSRLAHRRSWRVADLADRLAATAVLDQLGMEDRTVAGAFAASYEPLDERGRRVFRLLGCFRRPFDVTQAAALTGLPLAAAIRTVDDLVDRHLVEETEGDRYRLHDLVRQYANELSWREDASEQDAASELLLDFVLHAVLIANEGLFDSYDVRAELAPDEPRRPDLLAAAGPLGPDWLERERATLAGMVELANERGQHAAAWRLARSLWRFYYMRGYFDEIRETHLRGLASAEAAGDLRGMATMSNYLASAYLKTSEYAEAARLVDRAAALWRKLGDVPTALRYEANLAVVHWHRGQLAEAVALGRRILRDPGFSTALRIPVALPNLGLALTAIGHYDEALRIHRLHLFLARVNGDVFHTMHALGHLGAVRVRLRQWTTAIRLLDAALMLHRRTGHRYAETENRNDLGIAYRHLGRLDDALRQHQLALDLAVESGERHAQAAALNDLALTLVVAARRDEAARNHRRALELATRIAHPYEQGRALAGLAELTDDPDEAHRYRRRALAIFDRMGVPERFELRRRLGEAPA
ncbi:BTAD domain-containing putative transcriptional regulator [Micromonospora sp. PLK6-60]|uniref:AfsR/SARP family transcriptional regulator n=1 Tax=Micromonospora sp. PLK6-60 TaxID=2873383 RepID=UPI0027E1870B|nr:BTAD domain-containing putative transcriptional regulator [Micromonospora sp. PLK6-60]